MAEENVPEKKKGKNKNFPMSGASGGFWFLGFVATLIYYMQNADTFWMGVLGILKAMVWPAMLIYKVFTLLNM